MTSMEDFERVTRKSAGVGRSNPITPKSVVTAKAAERAMKPSCSGSRLEPLKINLFGGNKNVGAISPMKASFFRYLITDMPSENTSTDVSALYSPVSDEESVDFTEVLIPFSPLGDDRPQNDSCRYETPAADIRRGFSLRCRNAGIQQRQGVVSVYGGDANAAAPPDRLFSGGTSVFTPQSGLSKASIGTDFFIEEVLSEDGTQQNLTGAFEMSADDGATLKALSIGQAESI